MQWHQLDHMLTICTSLQTDNHTNTSSLNFYRPDALPDTQPTVSKHGRHIKIQIKYKLKITPRYYVTQTIMRLLSKKTRPDCEYVAEGRSQKVPKHDWGNQSSIDGTNQLTRYDSYQSSIKSR